MHVNINELMERKWAIGLMASIGVVITTTIVGFSSFYIFAAFGLEIPFIYCLLFGALGYPLITWVDDYQVEILITLALVISGYALAGFIHVSGPLAMSNTSREHLDTFWELIDEILNAVLFVLIGIEVLALAFDHITLVIGFIFIPVIFLARLLSTSFLWGVLRLKSTLTIGKLIKD